MGEATAEERISGGPEAQPAPGQGTAAAGAPAPERPADGAGVGPTQEQEDSEDPVAFLSGIELQAAVELGRAELAIGEILGLQPGSVVHLDKTLGDPVELVVKDRVIARGELVVIEDAFGLRVTQVLTRDHD